MVTFFSLDKALSRIELLAVDDDDDDDNNNNNNNNNKYLLLLLLGSDKPFSSMANKCSCS